MAEQAPVSSIKSRIAALNLEEVHAPAPGTRPSYVYEQATAKKKPPPPPPPSNRPSAQHRQHTINNPPITSNGVATSRQHGNQPMQRTPDTPKIQPALPPRPPPRNSPKLPPSLPPRKSSEPSIKRRESAESISTIASGISTLSIGSAKTSISGTSNGGQKYHIRAPAYDPSKLPPLPAKKEAEEANLSATRRVMESKSNLVHSSKTLPPKLPNRPPLPARQTSRNQNESNNNPKPRSLPPRPSALSFGLNKSTEAPPPVPVSRPKENGLPAADTPPPVPISSRPNLSAIMASKPKPSALNACLKCRDFTKPDTHAAQFPRQHLPSSDISWLANQLTAPFPSATDKARVIFTWLHHNIDYDTYSLFNNCVKPSTPESTLTSGLAVCEGYAGLFASLALKSGLEAIVIGGHGKGFGFNAIKAGDPLPDFNCGHAWNAVRIDNGEWKLIDPCWGAGALGCSKTYERGFNPSMFTMDNNEFGWRHFPEDSRYFFRTDGRASISWEEYLMNDVPERLQVYSPATPDHGIGERTFQPAAKHIKVHDPQNPVVRFQFATVCTHWDHEKNGKGKPYVMVLNYGGENGTQWKAFDTDGRVWWLDVNRAELGSPGQKVSVFSVDKVNGRDARGMSVDEYRRKQGKVGMGPFGGICMWELV